MVQANGTGKLRGGEAHLLRTIACIKLTFILKSAVKGSHLVWAFSFSLKIFGGMMRTTSKES